MSGQYEEAVAVLGKYAASDWKWTIGHLAAAYAHLGQMDEARRLAMRSVELQEKRLRKLGKPIPESPLAVILDGLKQSYSKESGFRKHVMDGFQKAGLT